MFWLDRPDYVSFPDMLATDSSSAYSSTRESSLSDMIEEESSWASHKDVGKKQHSNSSRWHFKIMGCVDLNSNLYSLFYYLSYCSAHTYYLALSQVYFLFSKL